MAIDQKQIDNLIQTANIVDIIGQYVDIQKKGRNYLAVCPFHDDSDPSLNISPDKKIFKCFVCGTGGNVISFVQEFKNINFFEALSIVSKEANFRIDGLNDFSSKPKHTTEQEKLYEINKKATMFFNGMIATNFAKRAKEYLANRNITKKEITKFQIGYCPKEAELYEYLLKNNFEQKDILNSGLIYSKGVNYKCFFEGRIIFPITDEDGNVIGFSGRAFNEGDTPKYKNSSENLVFKKSHLAYNFFNVKNQLRIKNEVLILEGFMDVISLERIGIKNSIAIMGTSFTDYHIKLISKYTKNFKLFLDGDKAGVNATIKTAKFLMDRKINVSIILNETGKDPDELVVSGKINEINNMIDNAKHPIDFVIEYFSKELSLNDSSKTTEFIKNVVDMINHESNSILREASLVKLAVITKIDKNILSEQVKLANPIDKNLNRQIEYENNGFNINYENEIPMFQPEIPDVSEGYLFKEYWEAAKNNDEEIIYIKKKWKEAKIGKRLAEASLIKVLLKNDDHLELINQNIQYFDNPRVKMIALLLIEKYKNNNNNEDIDFQTFADEVLKVSKEIYETFYDIKNILFLDVIKNYSQKSIDDMFCQIKIYSIYTEMCNIDDKMRNTNDLSMKKILAENKESFQKQLLELINKNRG
ncbi:DNA primase [Spiroplasma helicoides]|uniref:DNA primase n=1 Tax=Spiroplasma helicoides TaxID=216938 RepID=A0A1B3SL26_9MOLU|nr:DNA primase [Spiroplasma helicoides]AOG60617.1 DNA primase [Spiroplasma helicoides]